MHEPPLFRAHPVMIAQELKRFLFILILPLLRGFLTAASAGFSLASRGEWLRLWLSGAWLDALAVALLCTICILRWKSCYIGFDEAGFYYENGIFLQRSIQIPARSASTVSVVRTPLYRMMRAAVLHIDTLSGSKRRFAVRIPISARQAQEMLRLRGGSAREADTRRPYRPRNLYVAGIAALLSNSVAGLVYTVTAISQIGTLLGTTLSGNLHSGLVFLRSLYAFGLPPLTAILIYLILIGWAVGFLTNFIRHTGLTAIRSGTHLKISGGLLTKRDYSVEMDSVLFTDIRQTALGKLIGIMPVLIASPGFGKQRDDLKALMPLATRRRLQSELQSLLPGFIPVRRSVKPPARSWLRFMLLPLLLCAGVVPVVLTAQRLLPIPDLFSPVLPVMLLIPAVWLGAIRLWDRSTGGIGQNERFYTLRYSKGYILHTVTLPKRKLARVEIHQNPFQKRSGTCDVRVYPHAQSKSSHRLRGLDAKEAQLFFSGEGLW